MIEAGLPRDDFSQDSDPCVDKCSQPSPTRLFLFYFYNLDTVSVKRLFLPSAKITVI